MTQSYHLRIGTRGSPLALAQAHELQQRLAAAGGVPESAIEVRVFRTTGDRIQDRSLAEAGGKGLFTKEIEDALLAREVDVAVHSAKDLPTWLPDGLLLVGCLEREDVRDVFLSPHAQRPELLPQGARVGTASPRREAMMKRLRPDLRVETLRGNVETRLRKLEEGVVDATLLALAGLKRLRREGVATCILSADEFLPAVGQGAIAVECREDDARTHELLAGVAHTATTIAIETERAFLAALDGSCRTPIAGYAQVDGHDVHFRGLILRADGSETHATTREGRIAEAIALGRDAGDELKRRAPADFFEV
ncbi:MAG: hydroxymethylbilane synthase [Variibacter sp.]|jgi:hydroxymethylbilane synthase|nr:hydroxymethylbilane synthase [Variibacter sp.]